ncbi:hypothetical protein GCM10010435_92620 [Winogradskya consettensis]|uniref:Uncharacterized protein n=1 Tax=Winogradskya consettensis TaxID=113560 RepID=A0A919VVT4_9ACTN|nr:hypothetical protein [Actinoplanes consettensis]GIM71188.1 hypothetical protein Aco04nite_24050 [Actinoplanes consettensis]
MPDPDPTKPQSTDSDFTISVDPDDLAARDLAPAEPPPLPGHPQAKDLPSTHHGLADPRQAARDRSDRAHATRGTQGTGRTYAFRRS